MNWNDVGFLLSKNKYNENSIIAEIYTENYGKRSGIIYGASSKKIKNYLQIGNKLHINGTYKNEGNVGYFKVEILKAYTPLYFDSKKKLMCLVSAMNLVKLLTVDSQQNNKIFELIENFFILLNKDNWIEKYIFWELNLLKLIGYDLDLKKIVNQETINNKKIYYVKSKDQKKNVPSFLVEQNLKNLSNVELLKGLKLVGDYLDKNILRPNNMNQPILRTEFVNLLK